MLRLMLGVVDDLTLFPYTDASHVDWHELKSTEGCDAFQLV